MNISIIIPNYNGEQLLHNNLPKILDAVRSYKKGKVEIIIPDDPSTDDSDKVIEDFIKNTKDKNIFIKTISNKNKKYAGFSKNVNRGVGISSGEILILLNSDVYPHQDFLESLLKHFENPRVFAVGCMDESHEKGKIERRGRGIGKFKRGFMLHSRGQFDKSDTLWVSGGSGAFRRSIWEKLNGFDPLFDPFYWEDIDLSYRAQKAGYLTIFDQRSIVTHQHEIGVVKKLFSDKFVKKIAYRNQFIFVWKDITDFDFLINHILWLPYHLTRSIVGYDKEFLQGFVMALIKMPEILYKRSQVKKISVISDKEIIGKFKD